MSTSLEHSALCTCGCCQGARPVPPHYNPPGQPELSYRIGTYSTILARLQARLHAWELPEGDHAGQRPLAALTTRAPDDLSIALLDAWAVAGDVLTFYQERIANEGFLRTATERRSVLELARAIGYELRPGVAAGVYLTFTVDEGPGSPGEGRVAAGTQVQSLPTSQDELPQTFETGDDFTAYAAWNTLRPRLTRPQDVALAGPDLYLEGAGLNLQAGDLLLLVETDEGGTVTGTAPRHVRAVEPDPTGGMTYVTFEPAAGVLAAAAQSTGITVQQAGTASLAFNATQLNSLFSLSLNESALQAYLNVRRWKPTDVLDYAAALTTGAPPGIQVFVLREKLGIFGHNAPRYQSLPVEAGASVPRGYPNNWDDPTTPWPITYNTVTGLHYADATAYLERPVKGIAKDSWVVFEQPGATPFTCQVTEAFDASLAGFGMSAKGTGLDLTDGAGQARCQSEEGSLDDFYVRKTTAYVKSEELDVAAVPVTANLAEGATALELDGLVLGLQQGQAVALTGEQADAPGVLRSEVKFLANVLHTGGVTTLVFTEGLAYSYLRDTVTLNANVVHATHGETVGGEVLGGGDGAQVNQRFKLKKPPLTYVSAATPDGTESSLTVRVNGVAWEEAGSLYRLGGADRRYIVRHDDDANAYVVFGDGKSGARLPTGQENVVAAYRTGIGSAGEVDPGTITLLKKRPFGVKAVTNPLAAVGADDPEKLDDARGNAPLTVLTLDRIVSLRDYEDFARAFAGIGKARAVALWTGEAQEVHLTIADASGDPVADSADLFVNLSAAVAAARDPLQAVDIGSFTPLFFNVSARVWIDPAYVWEAVRADLEARLKVAFGFEARAFGQAVTSAEVIHTLHTAAGVVGVDLDELYRITDTGAPAGALLAPALPAHDARFDPTTGDVLPAELLLINTFGIDLTEAK